MKRNLTRGMVCLGLLAWVCLGPVSGAAAQAAYPQTFTDANGHSVTLEAKPSRIASVVLGMDENLLDLVDPSRIVTMTELSTNPGISNVAGRVPAGMTLIRDRWEDVVDANPDLVLVATYTPELADPIIERGLPVYQFSDFSNVEALLRNFETLGQLVGEDEKAQEILSARRADLREASDRSWSRPIRAIYYSEGFLVSGGTVPSELIGRAGLVDAAAEFGLVGFVRATPTLMDNLNPDVILVGEDSEEAAAATLAMFREPQFQIIAPVRTGRIFAIPGKHATTVSHNIVNAIADIQALPID